MSDERMVTFACPGCSVLVSVPDSIQFADMPSETITAHERVAKRNAQCTGPALAGAMFAQAVAEFRMHREAK